ncbi:hypothetical protein B0J17DRAFT_660626, partial [Rhizoctonia solani]
MWLLRGHILPSSTMLFLNPPPGTVRGTSKELLNQSGSKVFVSDDSEVEYNDNPAEVPTVKPREPVIRHSEFFFDNTLIAIQIENTLFNVHKYQLAKSEVFSEMFKMPKPKGDKSQQGSSPEHPIVIHGATASDFAALLKVLYASQFSSSQLAPEASLVIPAFRLASLLNFSEIRAYLLPLAEKNLDDVDKIVFAREFDIKEWLTPAHMRLCKRESILSTEEASKLGVQSVLLIWRMREHHRTQDSIAVVGTAYCSSCTGVGYWGNGNYTCQHCHNKTSSHHFHYIGPGKLGPNTSTDDASLEAAVEKWVEDDYASRTK